jgi:hypothetical protein
MPIVPDVRDVVGAVVGLVDARETSEGRVAEGLGGDVAVGAVVGVAVGDAVGAGVRRDERIGAGEEAYVWDVEGGDVQDGGCEVEYGAIVRGESG